MVREAYLQRLPPPGRRVRTAGWLLGASLAGLLDGILLPNATLAALAFWGLTLAAVAMLWRARARFAEPAGGRVLAGSALAGAGVLEAAAALAWPDVAPAWRAMGVAAALLALAVGTLALSSAMRVRRRASRRAGAA